MEAFVRAQNMDISCTAKKVAGADLPKGGDEICLSHQCSEAEGQASTEAIEASSIPEEHGSTETATESPEESNTARMTFATQRSHSTHIKGKWITPCDIVPAHCGTARFFTISIAAF